MSNFTDRLDLASGTLVGSEWGIRNFGQVEMSNGVAFSGDIARHGRVSWTCSSGVGCELLR